MLSRIRDNCNKVTVYITVIYILSKIYNGMSILYYIAGEYCGPPFWTIQYLVCHIGIINRNRISTQNKNFRKTHFPNSVFHSLSYFAQSVCHCTMWLSFSKSSSRYFSSFVPIFWRFNNSRHNIWRSFYARFHFWYILGDQLNMTNWRRPICTWVICNSSSLQAG